MTMPSHCRLALMWSIKIIEDFLSGTFGLIIQNSSASLSVSLPASYHSY